MSRSLEGQVQAAQMAFLALALAGMLAQMLLTSEEAGPMLQQNLSLTRLLHVPHQGTLHPVTGAI